MMLYAWVMVVLLLVLGTLVALHAKSAVEVYLGATERRPRNVTSEKREAQGAVAELLGSLALLGFRRLGEAELIAPDMGLLGPISRRRRRHTVWIMVDGPATTSAEVVAIRPAVSLESWFADDSVVQTTHPYGEDIDEPHLRAAVVRSNLPDTYDHHRLLLDERAAKRGQPRGVHSMGDYLRNDADYRRRFARRYLRRVTIFYQLVPAALVLAFCLVTLYSALSVALGGGR